MSNHFNRWFLLLALWCTPLHSTTVLLLGDSWAEPMKPGLESMFEAHGYSDVSVQTSEFWGLAARLASEEGLSFISAELAKYPGLEFVHLSTGINDLHCLLVENECQTHWNPDLIGSDEEASIIQTIMQDSQIVLDHILAQASDVQVLWAGGDWTRPRTPRRKFGSAAEHNSVHVLFSQHAGELAQSRPRVRYLDLFGLLQVKYGFDGVQYTEYDPPSPIPPGDPSLPDSQWPSPEQTFANQAHPTAQGYADWAEGYFLNYYQPMLENGGVNLGPGHNGNWWSGESRNGEGVQLEVADGGNGSLLVVATLYSYDTEGKQIFLVAVGTVEGASAELKVFITSGGAWGSNFDPASVSETQFGTGILTANGCESVTLEIFPLQAFLDQGYGDVILELIRLTTPLTPCEVVIR